MPNKPGQRPSTQRGPRHCVFCGIADGSESALFFRCDERRYLDSRPGEPSVPWSDEQPDVFVFENQFLFFNLTSLVIPRAHSDASVPFHAQQSELWRDLGGVGDTAREHGHQYVVWQRELHADQPDRLASGYRVFCNFGSIGEQSQPHAHLQVHAAPELDRSRWAPTGEPWTDAVCNNGQRIVHETETTIFYDALPTLAAGRDNLWQVTVQVGFTAPHRELPALALLAVPREPASQSALWRDVGQLGADVVDHAAEISPGGFRLMSNFPGQQADEDYGPAHVLIVGGSHLGLYADYF